MVLYLRSFNNFLLACFTVSLPNILKGKIHKLLCDELLFGYLNNKYSKNGFCIILLGLLILGFASSNFFPIVIRVALNNTKDNVNTAAANLATIGFLGFLIGPAIVGYTSEIYSIDANTKVISVIWIFLFLFFLITQRMKK